MSPMTDLVRKFSKASDLVVDFCASACSNAKAGMLLDLYRTSAEHNMDPDVLSALDRTLC